jgi:hypothetical protein
VQAYLITDPLEKDTPTSGRYAMSDGKSTAWVNAGNKQTRQIYTNTFEQQQEKIASELRHCRVNLNILSTVDNVSAV